MGLRKLSRRKIPQKNKKKQTRYKPFSENGGNFVVTPRGIAYHSYFYLLPRDQRKDIYVFGKGLYYDSGLYFSLTPWVPYLDRYGEILEIFGRIREVFGDSELGVKAIRDGRMRIVRFEGGVKDLEKLPSSSIFNSEGKCFVCGSDRNLTTHHIIPQSCFKVWGLQRYIHTPPILVELCRRCHNKREEFGYDIEGLISNVLEERVLKASSLFIIVLKAYTMWNALSNIVKRLNGRGLDGNRHILLERSVVEEFEQIAIAERKEVLESIDASGKEIKEYRVIKMKQKIKPRL